MRVFSTKGTRPFCPPADEGEGLGGVGGVVGSAISLLLKPSLAASEEEMSPSTGSIFPTLPLRSSLVASSQSAAP